MEQKGFILRPTIPSYSSFNGHMYYIQVLKKKRLDLIKYLNKKSIMSVFHYIPLHDSFFGKKKGVAKFSMDNTNIISKNLLRLPIHYEFEKNKAQIVCKTIYNLFNCKP